jgi:flagellin
MSGAHLLCFSGLMEKSTTSQTNRTERNFDMGMVVNTNVSSLIAQKAANATNGSLDTAMERLSTGKRINSAADDAAGVAITTRMTSQIKGLDQAVRNAADAQSLIDTTEGAHDEITNILQRMRELAVQSASDTNVSQDRASLNAESIQLIAEIDRIASQTTWNGMGLLGGTFTSKNFQIGSEANQTVSLSVDSVKAVDLGNFYHDSTRIITGQADHTATAIAAANTATTLTLTGDSGVKAFTQFATTASAKSMAADINAEVDTTGVKAEARTVLRMSGFAAGTVNLSLNGTNSTAVAVAASVVSATDVSALRDNINKVSGSTGITAAFENGDKTKLLLTHSTGENIQISQFTSTVDDTVAVDALFGDATGDATVTYNLVKDTSTAGNDRRAVTVTGTVSLSSSQSFSATAAGSGVFGTSVSSSSNKVNAVSLTTAAGATTAIDTIDGALEKISAARADLGAISNRLDNTVSNLTNIKVNVEASRSRIEDADFAAETANLTKSQILQQAATSMLAQANASKQSVLSLLQG